MKIYTCDGLGIFDAEFIRANLWPKESVKNIVLTDKCNKQSTRLKHKGVGYPRYN